MITLIATSLIEHGINTVLRLDPNAMQKMAQLTERSLEVHISDWQKSFYILIYKEGITITTHLSGTADATIKGSLPNFVHYLLSKDSKSNLQNFTIDGDMELVRHVEQIVQHLNIDWEEYLSYFLGDISSHQIANFSRDIKQWGQKALATTTENIVEYLQEELRLLLSPNELEVFYADIRDCANAVDRLEAKLKLIYSQN